MIAIQGIKISAINISFDRAEARYKFTGSYELISTTGVVLAKQAFNSYETVQVDMTNQVGENVNRLIATVQDSINATLGLT